MDGTHCHCFHFVHQAFDELNCFKAKKRKESFVTDEGCDIRYLGDFRNLFWRSIPFQFGYMTEGEFNATKGQRSRL